jgi:pilus assembly protein CpaE
VPSEPVGRLLATLKGMFDVVVVDTSGMFDDFVLHALDHTDSLVLVGTLDIPSLKSLKLAAGTLDLLNIPRERWRLVLNRADAKVGLSPDEFEDTLGLKATISIASSRDVLMAVNRGEPIVLLNRGHQASKALTSLASSLDQDPAVPPAPVALESKHASRRASRRGLRTRKVS